MTPRSIRRSQEREARKLARKQARLNVLETPEIETGLCTDNCDQQLTSTHSGLPKRHPILTLPPAMDGTTTDPVFPARSMLRRSRSRADPPVPKRRKAKPNPV